MGYTHYWELRKDAKGDMKDALEDIKKVIKRYKGLVQYEEDDKRDPIITENVIRFNGIGEDGHETFYFEYPPKVEENAVAFESDPGEIFNFCKTARKPYDIVVCDCLLILKAPLGADITLSSDGFSNSVKEFDGVWAEAIKEVSDMGYVIEGEVRERVGTPYFDCEIIKVHIAGAKGILELVGEDGELIPSLS